MTRAPAIGALRARRPTIRASARISTASTTTTIQRTAYEINPSVDTSMEASAGFAALFGLQEHDGFHDPREQVPSDDETRDRNSRRQPVGGGSRREERIRSAQQRDRRDDQQKV